MITFEYWTHVYRNELEGLYHLFLNSVKGMEYINQTPSFTAFSWLVYTQSSKRINEYDIQ
jgi:hypothetical protein